MRKYYIDHLRTFVILLLFPFHTLRMYTLTESFYIEGTPHIIPTLFVSITSIWFMNLLFVLAGMSTAYSIQKRSIKEYSKERFSKLLIPFIFGVVLTVPIQTYYAERFHNGYTGSFIEQYGLFFTKITDLSGYKGGLTPAHLWFLLFLFLISILSLPIINFVKKNGRKPLKKGNLWRMIPLFFIIQIFSIIEIGESIGQYMTYFIIGFLVLSREENLEEIQKNQMPLAIGAISLLAISSLLDMMGVLGKINSIGIFDLLAVAISAVRHAASWLTILALIGFGRKYLTGTNKIFSYLAKASFGIYFIHQTVIITIGYYVLSLVPYRSVQSLVIMILSFIATIAIYVVLKRCPVLNTLFGMKKSQPVRLDHVVEIG